MTDDEWGVIEMMLEEGWPGKWGPNTGKAYRMILGDLDSAAVLAVIRKVALESRHRPSAGDLLRALHEDPELPPFVEAYEAIYGPRGALMAAPAPGPCANVERAYDDAALAAVAGAHPMVSGFVRRYGVRRLRMLPVGDPVWGEKVRRDLGEEYDAFVAAELRRSRHGLAIGEGAREPGARGLRRLQPLAGLHPTRRELPALPPGDG